MNESIVYIAVGPFCWGRAKTVDTAIAEMRKNWSGRYNAKKVKIIKITGDPEAYIDGMGGLVRSVGAKVEHCTL